jgi:hypothetical protein
VGSLFAFGFKEVSHVGQVGIHYVVVACCLLDMYK